MMNVLHLLTSTAWGGLELYAVTLMRELQRRGIRQAVFCSRGTNVEKEAADAGLTVCHATGNKLRDVLRVRELSKTYGVLHAHHRVDVKTAAVVALGSSRVRVVYSVYMNAIPKKGVFHRIIHNQVDAFISSAAGTNEDIHNNYIVPNRKIHLIRYGRDAGKYHADQAERERLRQAMGVGGDELLVGMMCRIDEQKGIADFARSYQLLSDEARSRVHYCIFGEPTIAGRAADGMPVYEAKQRQLQEWLEEYIRENSIFERFHLFGFRKNYLDLLGAYDVYVIASWNEMYSLGVIDAMMLGLPVIGTANCGTLEQVRDGVTGFLVPTHGSREIARSVEQYLKRPELLKLHGRAGREWALGEHEMDGVIRRYLSVYQGLAPD